MKKQGLRADQQGVAALEKTGFWCRSARRGSAWPIKTVFLLLQPMKRQGLGAGQQGVAAPGQSQQPVGSQVSGSEAGGAGVGQPHLEARVP